VSTITLQIDTHQEELLRHALKRWSDWSGLSAEKRAIGRLLSQISAQVRIDEPGLWGVVVDEYGFDWFHTYSKWIRVDGCILPWADIAHPTLIRAGVDA